MYIQVYLFGIRSVIEIEKNKINKSASDVKKEDLNSFYTDQDKSIYCSIHNYEL